MLLEDCATAALGFIDEGFALKASGEQAFVDYSKYPLPAWAMSFSGLSGDDRSRYLSNTGNGLAVYGTTRRCLQRPFVGLGWHVYAHCRRAVSAR